MVQKVNKEYERECHFAELTGHLNGIEGATREERQKDLHRGTLCSVVDDTGIPVKA